jgi:hypothetical protein
MIEIILLVSVFTLMYLEGAVAAGVATAVLKPAKFVIPLIVLLWPVALPILAYSLYKKFYPLVVGLRDNPLILALAGIDIEQNEPNEEVSSLFQNDNDKEGE